MARSLPTIFLRLASVVLTLGPLLGADVPKPDATNHWSFKKPLRVGPPSAADEAWNRNPIDQFIYARLANEGIKPSPRASRETLIRRVSLDLTGLPPSPEETKAFVDDQSTDAYVKLIERLLASPHYGERWGRHWLDVARYADSNGYSQDNPRSIWKYRDWVIDAVNRDMPFDQFVVEQLAGDLLPNATKDQLVATGFHRNTQINEEGGIDPEQFRVEAIVDRVGTTGTGLLGLSVACAQCHNHKYDPISQSEYYEMYAFFNNCDEPQLEFFEDPAIGAKYDAIGEELKTRDATLDTRVAEWEAKLKPEEIEAIPSIHLRGALKTPVAERNDKQRRQVRSAVREMDEVSKKLVAEQDSLKSKATTTLILRERTEDPRETHIHLKGDFTRPGDLVSPGVLGVLHPFKPSSGKNPNRLDLAHWIVDKENPLTARVTMNRMWQAYFGHGIVDTENDFGTQGALPTHPELLDFLALEFQSHGWSMKAMHRLIVSSETYQQSSKFRPELANADPYNGLLARQSRLRLDAEIVRDVALVASGLFTEKVGGKSVYPPQPEGVTDVGQSNHKWETSKGPDRYRRGMYTFFFRASPHPLLGSFDAPDGTAICTRRNRSNTPLQALNLLNDEAFIEFAQGLAARVLKETPAPNEANRIEYAFEICTGRKPLPAESKVLLGVLQDQRASLASFPNEAKAIAGDYHMEGIETSEFAAWTMVCRVALNLDETITRE
jgi:hypothetical protein